VTRSPADPAEVFDHFSTAEVDLNDNGDFVFSGFDRGPDADDSWIYKSIGGVIHVIAHEGDAVPASVPGGWLVAGAGFGGVVPMSDTGSVLWFLDWSDPDTTRDTGLLLDDQLLLQEGVSMLGGLVLEDVPNGEDEVAMSDDGAFGIIEVVLDDAAGDKDAVFLVTFDQGLGTNYCTANPNSTGVAAEISATGSLVVVDNDVTLMASSLPPNAFSFFICSRNQGFSANPGGSAGNVCLGSPIGRGVGNMIVSSGPMGVVAIPANLTAMPQPLGAVAVLAGDTWNFQCWYRDVVGGIPTSNFSDGLTLLFQ
jgi:hypothetical protein